MRLSHQSLCFHPRLSPRCSPNIPIRLALHTFPFDSQDCNSEYRKKIEKKRKVRRIQTRKDSSQLFFFFFLHLRTATGTLYFMKFHTSKKEKETKQKNNKHSLRNYTSTRHYIPAFLSLFFVCVCVNI